MSNGDNILGSYIACLLALLTLFILVMIFRPEPQLPICPEDSTIVGFGQYESGYWEHYACGPAFDDYLVGE